MTELAVDIPMPPSANAIYERKGRHLTRSKAYRQWLGEATWFLLFQRNRYIRRHTKITHNVEVEVRAYRQKDTPDLDNILKPIMDLLVHTDTIKDDKQVVAINARWSEDGGAPCTITVRPA